MKFGKQGLIGSHTTDVSVHLIVGHAQKVGVSKSFLNSKVFSKTSSLNSQILQVSLYCAMPNRAELTKNYCAQLLALHAEEITVSKTSQSINNSLQVVSKPLEDSKAY